MNNNINEIINKIKNFKDSEGYNNLLADIENLTVSEDEKQYLKAEARKYANKNELFDVTNSEQNYEGISNLNSIDIKKLERAIDNISSRDEYKLYLESLKLYLNNGSLSKFDYDKLLKKANEFIGKNKAGIEDDFLERSKDNVLLPDAEYFYSTVMIPRKIYEYYSEALDTYNNKIAEYNQEVEEYNKNHKNKKKKKDFKLESKKLITFLIVLFVFQKEGKIEEVKLKDMADVMGYKDTRIFAEASQVFEEIGFIKVDRNVKPRVYYINDLFMENKKIVNNKGFITIPFEFISKNIKDLKLKELRLCLFLFSLNAHTPRNHGVKITLKKLKKVTKSESYEEVIRIIKDLEDILFDSYSVEPQGTKRIGQTEIKLLLTKGKQKVEFDFNKNKLGYISDRELAEKIDIAHNMEKHHYYNDIRYIFKNINITMSSDNFLRALSVINSYNKAGDYFLKIVKDNSVKDEFYSNYSTVGYFKFMFELASEKAIFPIS
ncbi:hypothetical protein [Orenia marismortui]|nr:hypothetical protein [Orenia marismortui]